MSKSFTAAAAAMALVCPLLTATPAAATPVQLPAGMTVPLELQHHVNSGYTPAGSPIYFRVARDVTVGGRVLVAKGTLVTGKMLEAQERGMVGRSGSMSLNVRLVKGVDGTDVPIEADLAKQGRSRTGAMVAWTLFWGVPGLVTRGVNPYMEKGTEIAATTLADAAVDPDTVQSAAATAATAAHDAAPFTIATHKLAGYRVGAKIDFDIERHTNLKTIEFRTNGAAIGSLRLESVDDVPVPEETLATSVGASGATFDGWSIVRFCHEGATRLHFVGTDAAGRAIAGDYQLPVHVKKKG